MGDGVKPPPVYYPNMPDNEQTLGDFLDELVAYFMTIGMPWHEIMYGERSAFDDYILAYEYKRVQVNSNLHMQGFYDYNAVSCALSSAFAEKGKKGTPYPKYPVPVTEIERKAEKERNIMHTLEVVRNRKRVGGQANG